MRMTKRGELRINRSSKVLLGCLFLIGRIDTVWAQDITLEALPPVVVESTPRAGEAEVDPGLKEIRVTFSKEMQNGSWSAVQLSPESFPEILGKPKYLEDGRTWVINVRLKPGTVYAIWLNKGRFQGFKDTDGQSAPPYLFAFQTKGKREQPREGNTGTKQLTPEIIATAYDALWRDMARNYSYFELKQVDPEALSRKYRDQAIRAKSKREFLGILQKMLSELRDCHVWIEHQGRNIPTYRAEQRPRNIHLEATLGTLEGVQYLGNFVAVGLTKPDGYAAVVVVRQSEADETLVRRVVDFIQANRDAPGFLVDLRLANGGNESLAEPITRQFCSEDTLYALSKNRDGPQTTDFSRPHSRILSAGKNPVEKPVVCLLGSGCVSSGEAWAKMLNCLPQVTTVGEATRGSSGNPAPFRLPGIDASVWYSRWVDMLPDGSPVEDVGIVPDVVLEISPDAYRDEDPTWERAISELRDRAK